MNKTVISRKMVSNGFIIALVLCFVFGLMISCSVKDNNEVNESVYTVKAGVTSIDSHIFENINIDVIGELIVSKDVKHIDFDYLSTFPALQKITVDSENDYYASQKNFIVSRDGSGIYLYGTNAFDPVVFTYVEEVCDLSQPVNEMRVMFGNAIIFVECTYDQEFESYFWGLEKIEAYGQALTYSSTFGGNRAPDIYIAHDYVLMTDYGKMTGSTYIISSHGIWDYHTNENALTTSENYNEPIYTFSIDEKGICSFTCQPRKYLFSASAGNILPYSMGIDELYSVEGIVTVSNGVPDIFTVSSEETLSSRYTEEQLLAELVFFNRDNELFEESTYATLDELFTSNAKKYERFVFEPDLLTK